MHRRVAPKVVVAAQNRLDVASWDARGCRHAGQMSVSSRRSISLASVTARLVVLISTPKPARQ
jgi:hypothetical protein